MLTNRTKRSGSARAAGIARLALCACAMMLGPVSCVEVEGGAVELAWVLRTPLGHAVSSCECANPPIKWVRLRLAGRSGAVLGTDPCAGRDACRFACKGSNGTTPLDIPEGEYDISVEPLDASGGLITREDGTRATPEPITRTVSWGQSVDMGAVQIVTACAERCFTNIASSCED
jgi:hypothetical protein